MESLGNWKASMVQHDSLNFDRGVCSALSLSPLRRAFERSLAYEQIRQNKGMKLALLLPFVNAFDQDFC